MKKILVLVSMLIVAAACTMQPAGNSNMTANTNNGGEMKSTAAPSEADLIAKEKSAWDAFKKKDADAFNKLLTTDYVEVIDTGVKDKAKSIEGMKDFELTDVSFSDWKMTPIDKDAALLTYQVNNVKGQFKGQDIPPGPYYEASVYVNRNGEWQGIYYQETLSQKMPPPPPAAEKKSASSPATAPAKPPETGPDPIANEKIVWDLFKAKNWDGFASLLAPEFMEVEASGVYDKAGSVKSVQDMGGDMSEFEQSDWKAVPFDDDAKLVTYTIMMKGPKPETEYHSTIWINRGGKWLGLYHMGTPAQAATGTPTASPAKKM
jgi:hypothetical protein